MKYGKLMVNFVLGTKNNAVGRIGRNKQFSRTRVNRLNCVLLPDSFQTYSYEEAAISRCIDKNMVIVRQNLFKKIHILKCVLQLIAL